MAFNYARMQKTAKKLLSPKGFGSPFLLKKVSGQKYDLIKKKTIKTYEEFEGVGIILPIAEETIGALSTIVKAGDKKFVCQMNDELIIPIETKDQIIFENETYNILSVKSLIPNGKKMLIHTLIIRKATQLEV
ncbi:MAG: hypothetical protein KBT03_05865 [Bacteroidales bacterium]|nr:hypothetical protein [Candidatus Scybalousia scybalohippi]